MFSITIIQGPADAKSLKTFSITIIQGPADDTQKTTFSRKELNVQYHNHTRTRGREEFKNVQYHNHTRTSRREEFKKVQYHNHKDFINNKENKLPVTSPRVRNNDNMAPVDSAYSSVTRLKERNYDSYHARYSTWKYSKMGHFPTWNIPSSRTFFLQNAERVSGLCNQ